MLYNLWEIFSVKQLTVIFYMQFVMQVRGSQWPIKAGSEV